MMWLRLLFPDAQCTSGENLQNSNVFQQLFGVHAPNILFLMIGYMLW